VILKIAPRSLHALVSNTCLFFGLTKDSRYFASSAINVDATQRYAVSLFLESFQQENDQTEIDTFIDSTLDGTRIDVRRIDAILSWAFWNVSHKQFGSLLNRVMRRVENLDCGTQFHFHTRYLPDYSRNLGHLTSLFLYLRFYEQQNARREVNLIAGRADNSFLLELIRRSTPMQVNLLEEKQFPKKTNENFHSFDHLLYSFESPNKIRAESGTDHSFNQDSPEWNLAYKNPLTLHPQEIDHGSELMSRYLKGRWFVALHIRGPLSNRLEDSQGRDALISDYELLCQYVYDIGGLVVRMGDKRFPPLNRCIPAFDYAHHVVRSQFLDCWLWATCKLWVGNPNGAALTALAFGKKRLITNQWYWNLRGTSDDFVVPKLLLRDGRIVTMKDVFKSGMSRQMSRVELRKHGYVLRENSPEEIRDAFVDFMELSNHEESLLTKELKSGLGFEESNHDLMRISPGFSQKWTEALLREVRF
jgi:putative glycosyltransferase (TIGR04372 family)